MTDVYVGWVWFYSCIQCFTSLYCGPNGFLFFFLPAPWPSLSQCFLLALSMRDSGHVGLSPFPFWEFVPTFWVVPGFSLSIFCSTCASSLTCTWYSWTSSWDLSQGKIMFLFLFPISMVTIFTNSLIKTQPHTQSLSVEQNVHYIC